MTGTSGTYDVFRAAAAQANNSVMQNAPPRAPNGMAKAGSFQPQPKPSKPNASKMSMQSKGSTSRVIKPYRHGSNVVYMSNLPPEVTLQDLIPLLSVVG